MNMAEDAKRVYSRAVRLENRSCVGIFVEGEGFRLEFLSCSVTFPATTENVLDMLYVHLELPFDLVVHFPSENRFFFGTKRRLSGGYEKTICSPNAYSPKIDIESVIA